MRGRGILADGREHRDALKGQPDKVLVCEGESDTWTALAAGDTAVGSPGARLFKPAWVEGVRSRCRWRSQPGRTCRTS